MSSMPSGPHFSSLGGPAAQIVANKFQTELRFKSDIRFQRRHLGQTLEVHLPHEWHAALNLRFRVANSPAAEVHATVSVLPGNEDLFAKRGSSCILDCAFMHYDQIDDGFYVPSIQVCRWTANEIKAGKEKLLYSTKGSFELINVDFSLQVVGIEMRPPGMLAGGSIEAARKLSKQVSAMTRERSPWDVRLSFAATGRQLWTNSKMLLEASPRFEAALSGDKRPAHGDGSGDVEMQGPPRQAEDDSDFEVDEVLKVEKAAEGGLAGDKTDNDKSNSEIAGLRSVTIDDTAFVTYRALLGWLSSGLVEFAPLKNGSKHAEERLKGLVELLDNDEAIPTSPKSLYRLATKLELADLRKACFKEIKKQNSIDIAVHQLFSKDASDYSELRDVWLANVATNWLVVKNSPAWLKMKAKADADESGCSNIFADLLARVM